MIRTPSDSRQKTTWPAEWPGDVEDLEAGDLVAVVELAVDGVAGAGEDRDVEAGDGVAGLTLADQLGVLGGVGVALGDPEGDAERLADRVA